MAGRLYPELAHWLTTQRQAQNISIRELARRMGLTHTTLANAEQGKGLSVRTAKMVARFFQAAQEDVMRMAGHLDKLPNPNNYLMEQIVDEGNGLSEPDKAEVLEFIRLKARLRKQRSDTLYGKGGKIPK